MIAMLWCKQIEEKYDKLVMSARNASIRKFKKRSAPGETQNRKVKNSPAFAEIALRKVRFAGYQIYARPKAYPLNNSTR